VWRGGGSGEVVWSQWVTDLLWRCERVFGEDGDGVAAGWVCSFIFGGVGGVDGFVCLYSGVSVGWWVRPFVFEGVSGFCGFVPLELVVLAGLVGSFLCSWWCRRGRWVCSFVFGSVAGEDGFVLSDFAAGEDPVAAMRFRTLWYFFGKPRRPSCALPQESPAEIQAWHERRAIPQFRVTRHVKGIEVGKEVE